ncbi:MAG: type II toxin-antitoxin system VapC family toxin [Nitriliruptorales bacterium]
MRALLDTHAWLWMLTDPERLGDALVFVDDADNELLLSAASSWEISIKYALGRLPLPEPPSTYVPARIRSTGVTPLAVEHTHALAVADLPDHHRDPFDRLLVAQGSVEAVPIITADEVLAQYDVDVMLAG